MIYLISFRQGGITIKKLIIILLLCLVSMGACTNNSNSIGNIKIYLADDTVSNLITKETSISKDNLKDIISETIRVNNKCFNPDTKILNIDVKDKIAYVDLSKEFDDPNTNSSALARLKVYSIVNVLCLNKELNIDGVYFLIDGKQQDSVAGMMIENGEPFRGKEEL